MSKQELYRELCVEAGTYTGGSMTAEEWYRECSHNITQDLDETLTRAANGDAGALAEARQAVGLPILT